MKLSKYLYRSPIGEVYFFKSRPAAQKYAETRSGPIYIRKIGCKYVVGRGRLEHVLDLFQLKRKEKTENANLL